MKKYVVIMVMQYVTPSVVFQSDDEQRAKTYAKVMSEEEGREYVVAKVEE